MESVGRVNCTVPDWIVEIFDVGWMYENSMHRFPANFEQL